MEIEQQPNDPVEVSLRRASDYLQDSWRTTSIKHSYDLRRFNVTLKSPEIFQSLLNEYTKLFKLQWNKLKPFLVNYLSNLPDAGPQEAATVYISSWFHDLYCTNREAVRELSPIAYCQSYLHEEVLYSQEYDEFLVLLNAHLRPTPLTGLPENKMYIPLIAANASFTGVRALNPFNIPGYLINDEFFLTLKFALKAVGYWKFAPLVTAKVGRPFWLLDWHDNKAYSWFPLEGNYNAEDVAIAYIIGVACTPNLAFRDVDDWQDLPARHTQATLPLNYARARPLCQTGGCNVRTYEFRDDHRIVPIAPPRVTRQTQKKRKPTQATTGTAQASKSKAVATTDQPQHSDAESQAEAAPLEGVQEPSVEARELATVTEPAYEETFIEQFRATDWIYYHQVILVQEDHTRAAAIKMFALKLN